MPLCPNQHESRASDFCETCGVEILPASGAGDRSTSPKPDAGSFVICPACHAEHNAGAGDFCEVCGYCFKTGVRPIVDPPDAEWEIIIAVVPIPHAGTPDAPQTPPVFAERILALTADSLLIGRRSVRRGIEPEIPLDHDDGISHRHAQLTRLPDGSYSLADLGSSNGTSLDGAEIPAGSALPLTDGSTITLGRWTRLRLQRRLPPSPEISAFSSPQEAPASHQPK